VADSVNGAALIGNPDGGDQTFRRNGQQPWVQSNSIDLDIYDAQAGGGCAGPIRREQGTGTVVKQNYISP
jgi:hypothetical protein